MRYEWDDAKAIANQAKHGVDFEEASTVFEDAWARVIDDPDHSQEEQRFIILGLSLRARILVVFHCLRQEGNAIRIISARRATRREAEQYWRCRS